MLGFAKGGKAQSAFVTYTRPPSLFKRGSAKVCQPKRLINGAKGVRNRAPMFLDHWNPPSSPFKSKGEELTWAPHKEALTPCTLVRAFNQTPLIAVQTDGAGKSVYSRHQGSLTGASADQWHWRSYLRGGSGWVVFTCAPRQTSECPLIDFLLWVNAAPQLNDHLYTLADKNSQFVFYNSHRP